VGEQSERGQINTSLCPQATDNKGTLEEQSQTKPNFGVGDEQNERGAKKYKPAPASYR
jgi:hypothetical protein